MIVVFDHQLVGILNGFREAHENLEIFAEKIRKEYKKEFQDILGQLNEWIEDAKHQGELLGLLIGKESRKRRKRLPLYTLAETVKSAFNGYMRDMGIEFENNIPSHIKTPPVFECELMAILINLMTNALKAVREQYTRHIGVYAERDRGKVTLLFCDTGSGLDLKKREEYFKPFVGESEPDPMLGHGTGLGLKIVRDLLDIYGGTAKFTTPEGKWKTCIEIVLPED